jgi:hypothetical protein
VPASAELVGFMSELAERADRVRSRAVRPQQDNMLLISSHGRAAALDMRLVGHPMTPGESKIEAADGANRGSPEAIDRLPQVG